ncbi:hypothetical protein [Haliea sp. E17]|uniref:hypothetical protein n=1 Tax=Haliea sp. E17 TaxID=3401576 RepID=UPI003AAE895C
MNQTSSIHPELLKIALERVDGFVFERYCQDLLSVLEGKNFVPVGGIGDGGADGIFECGDDRIFYQFTRQENHREKIRRTVDRLREVGRNVKTLYYLSSRTIPHIDSDEDKLTDELGVFVKIRDRKYLLSHANDTNGTVAAFNNHLSIYTQFLNNLATDVRHPHSPHVQNPAAYVFLQHEVTNRLGDRKLVHSLTDTLILWALSETDPDNDIFLTEEEIAEKIFSTFPWSSRIIKGHLRGRIKTLRNKDGDGREIRWYKKSNKYCLPFETRKIIADENVIDQDLGTQFIDELKLIAGGLFDEDEGAYQKIAELACDVIHKIFEKQGLLFSHFLSSDSEIEAPPIVSDCIDNVLETSNIGNGNREEYREIIEEVIRKVFYQGSAKQRDYLANLSRTYVLLFTLQAEPKIMEYFSTMTANFRIYVGTDILVKALSERFLDKEDQAARNLLRMAKDCGIKLFFSECVLDEVYTHIRGTYFEFINYFSEMEPYITREIARNSDKILIRSYFYAKYEGKISGWKSFLGQFVTYENIQSQKGRDEIRNYLSSEFGLSFVENAELEEVCELTKVNSLAEKLLEADAKENQQLAYNTALFVHGIYGLRSKNKEHASASEYGLRTWWMTNQSKVLKHTTEIIRDRRSQYIMRPEFLLNFLALSPTCDDVRNSFHGIFPSVFGVQLGHRLRDDVFHKVMRSVKEWKEYEPGRITALMSELSDKLKTDRYKRYDRTLADGLV